MRSIVIETAVNGYIAREAAPRHASYMSIAEHHVFETFEGLTEWLSEQLEKPKPDEDAPAAD